MSTDPVPPASPGAVEAAAGNAHARTNSFSQQSHTSEDSQTALEFIRSQELLEADAREALPYSIESCTRILGPLRQNVFACLTCNPAPPKPEDSWTPAGVCYACSVQCHGEHTLVEIFQKRNFTCDCGTTRIPSTSPCALQVNSETNTKGNVHSEEPDVNNKYNANFRNRFCGCECDYDPFQQKGTMFQCLGLGTHESGGCGEDWYHPGCLVGMGPKWYEKMNGSKPAETGPRSNGNGLSTISEDAEAQPDGGKQANEVAVEEEEEEDEPPMPPGFPEEDGFEGFLCYKCVEANPWIKQYAGTSGFLPPVYLELQQPEPVSTNGEANSTSKKRKAEDDEDNQTEAKRVKSEEAPAANGTEDETSAALTEAQPVETELKEPANKEEAAQEDGPLPCKLPNLGPAPTKRFSLFFREDFRERFCRCSDCYPKLAANPQLLEEEEVYEPPISEDGASQHGGSTHGSGSLLERGESALRNVDRVRAIEGVMAYNHLKERLKPFFQQFAESGQAVSAEDIKAYFAKLRGDEEGMKEAGKAAASSKDGGGDADADADAGGRREQKGY